MADVLPARAAAVRPLSLPGRLGGRHLLLLFLAFYVGALALWPLGLLFVRALGPDAAGAPLGILSEQWSGLAAQRALFNTIKVGVFSTLLSVVIGTAAAVLVALTDIRAKTAAVFTLFLPILVPSQITALAWIELTGPTSPLLSALGLARGPGTTNPLYSEGGIILVMGVEHAALVFLAVRAALRDLPGTMVEAARVGGGTPAIVIRRILLPMAAPSILSGAALAFVASIGNFGVPALLGIPGRYPMLTTLIYQRLQGFGAKAIAEVAALALALAALAAFGLLARRYFAGRLAAPAARSQAPLTPFALGPARPFVEAATWVFLIAIAVLPLVALVATSLVPALGVTLGAETATLAHYRFILFDYPLARRAMANSLLLAFAAAVISAAIAVPLAYQAVVERQRGARILDALADLPYAIPGTVLGIAIIIALLPPLPVFGFSLYNTGWILLIAYLARFLALALRPATAALESLHPAVDEAAKVAGAHTMRRLRTIILPLIAPTVAAGSLLIFMQALNELTVSALLWSSGWETLGVGVFFLQREGNSPAAAALATLSLVAALLAAGAFNLFGRRLPPGVVPWRA